LNSTDCGIFFNRNHRRTRLRLDDSAVPGGQVSASRYGLWIRVGNTWRKPADDEEIQSCTVLTCAPNDAMAEIHNRMPVILAKSDWPKWLGEDPATEQELLALLWRCPDERLKIWRVDNKVGNVRNTGPELILPLEDPQP
jgi:putative SOS response-associated peptidase YedK